MLLVAYITSFMVDAISVDAIGWAVNVDAVGWVVNVDAVGWAKITPLMVDAVSVDAVGWVYITPCISACLVGAMFATRLVAG